MNSGPEYLPYPPEAERRAAGPRPEGPADQPGALGQLPLPGRDDADLAGLAGLDLTSPPPAPKRRGKLVAGLVAVVAALAVAGAASWFFLLRDTSQPVAAQPMVWGQAPDLLSQPRLGDPVVVSSLADIGFDQVVTSTLSYNAVFLDATHVAVMVETFMNEAAVVVLDLATGQLAWELNLNQATGWDQVTALGVWPDGQGGAVVQVEQPNGERQPVLLTVDAAGSVTGRRAGAEVYSQGPPGYLVLTEANELVVAAVADLSADVWRGEADLTADLGPLVADGGDIFLVATAQGHVNPLTGQTVVFEEPEAESQIGTDSTGPNWERSVVYYCQDGMVFQVVDLIDPDMYYPEQFEVMRLDPVTGQAMWDEPVNWLSDIDPAAGVGLTGGYPDDGSGVAWVELVDLATGQTKWRVEGEDLLVDAHFVGSGDVVVQWYLEDEGGGLESSPPETMDDLTSSQSLDTDVVRPGETWISYGEYMAELLDGTTGGAKGELWRGPLEDLVQWRAERLAYTYDSLNRQLNAYLLDTPLGDGPLWSFVVPGESSPDALFSSTLPDQGRLLGEGFTLTAVSGHLYLMEEQYDAAGVELIDLSFRELTGPA
ncbi:MAG: hypothetical protein LBR19_08470 [Bifidobacteriaceae bacterium]|nr:hypothetical protein [Bifidobacteriaceae bacterium]